MEQLRQVIAELEQKESILSGSEKIDHNSLNVVRNKLSEKRYELQQLAEQTQKREAAIEEKVEADGIPFAIDGIDMTELDPETITLVNLILKADRRRIYNEHAIELEMLEIEALKNGEMIEKLRRADEENEQVKTNLRLQIEELEQRHRDYEMMIADANSKRDAAVQKYEDAELDIDRLQKTINELRARVAEHERIEDYNARQEQPITEVTETEAEGIKAAIAALAKKKYVKAENWGSVEKLTLPDESFVVVPRSELTEWEEAVVPSVEEATVEPPTLDTFREDTESAGSELVGHTVEAESVQNHDGEPKSVEEILALQENRIWNLEQTVEQLNRKVFGEIAA